MTVSAEELRTWGTWLLLASVVAASAISLGSLSMVFDIVAPRLRSLDPSTLPAFTAMILDGFGAFRLDLWIGVLALGLVTFLARRYSSTPERAHLTIALTAGLALYLIVMMSGAVLVGLIVLPHAKGI